MSFRTITCVRIRLTFLSESISQNLIIISINGVEAVKGELLIKFRKPIAKIKANQIASARNSILTKHDEQQIKKFKIGVELQIANA